MVCATEAGVVRWRTMNEPDGGLIFEREGPVRPDGHARVLRHVDADFNHLALFQEAVGVPGDGRRRVDHVVEGERVVDDR